MTTKPAIVFVRYFIIARVADDLAAAVDEHIFTVEIQPRPRSAVRQIPVGRTDTDSGEIVIKQFAIIRVIILTNVVILVDAVLQDGKIRSQQRVLIKCVIHRAAIGPHSSGDRVLAKDISLIIDCQYMTGMRNGYIGQAAVQVTQLIPAAGLQQQLIIRSFPHAAVEQRCDDLSCGQIDRTDPSAAIVTRGKYQLPDVLFLDQSTRKNLAAVNLPSFPCRVSRITGILFWWALLKMRDRLPRKLCLRCGICGSGANQHTAAQHEYRQQNHSFFHVPYPLAR